MERSIDPRLLANLTGGDVRLQAELFDLFFQSAEACVDGLKKAMQDEDRAAWRKQAHAFKGICLNLGANPLGALCRAAQTEMDSSFFEKNILLGNITHELARLRTAVAGLTGSRHEA